MKRQVRVTEQASQDLDAIAGYIARDSWLRGSQFVTDALNQAELLAKFPERGRVVPEFNRVSVHEVVCTASALLTASTSRWFT